MKRVFLWQHYSPRDSRFRTVTIWEMKEDGPELLEGSVTFEYQAPFIKVKEILVVHGILPQPVHKGSGAKVYEVPDNIKIYEL